MSMARAKEPKAHIYVILLIVVVIIGIIAAPRLLPLYRWFMLDFAEIAAKHKVKESDVRTVHEVTIRYDPRGDDDPSPWQLLSFEGKTTPPWATTASGDLIDEYQTLVRVTLLNDHTGKPPSKLWMGMRKHLDFDRYWTAKAWRLPAGALGQSPYHPVLVYQGLSLERLPKSRALFLANTIRPALKKDEGEEGKWYTDDDPYYYPERDDGYIPPRQRPKKEKAPADGGEDDG
jgi:hypothetical protein